ncbi:branched-chain amino acid ABC transporter permease [Mesorhizobium sp. YIM 152430]|uniref:branched-chain amino acid ABC transporter permease n=1 Tax=Mesorhizobium sp. YIM 152430 TaxID=3031761 RepID=UPI0023D9BDB5|nr:branched-chain amino acid ABC transporter permease [Mesorhizobium sp. YIM 152430]MDF1599231.1 branched-chain amino acid ABC transporter permease [Mesorhizobium sp. YIM 152430]
MSNRNRIIVLYSIMAGLLLLVGFGQSWTLSLTILNLCLISAIMALGVNIQWGYAGLFNVGIMGFAALGGLAGIVVSMPPVPGAWSAGGTGIGLTIIALIGTIGLIVLARRNIHGRKGNFVAILIAVAGYFVIRHFFDPAVAAIESYDAARTGYLGGLGLPILFSWLVGGVFAAGAAWMVGKIALGLRADYLAIATLGISEIIIAVLRNEEWLTRGVKNVSGLPRPVAYEVQLQQAPWFLDLATTLNLHPVFASAIYVRLSYAILFAIVLIIIMFLAERALNSPWGRMMRAIRDNRDAAEAMGKDVTRRHLQVFILGSAVVGIAGAMLTTLDGQFTPGQYQPLRFTFLIWVMVIVGGSGNNWGAVLGGFLIWFVWVEAEPVGGWVMSVLTSGMDPTNPLRLQLVDAAPYMRPLMMGLILLLVLRFSPRGLIPERTARPKH